MAIKIIKQELPKVEYSVITVKKYNTPPFEEEVIKVEPIIREPDETDKELIERALIEIANSDFDNPYYDKDRDKYYTLMKKIITQV
jgi:hypothetical protein